MVSNQPVDLPYTVHTDIIKFIKNNHKLFFNERDLQINLAIYLKETSHYDNIEVEYFVPKTILPLYGNLSTKNERLFLDIVVIKDGLYIPIELKYKTKTTNMPIDRFGKQFDKLNYTLANQGAHDLGLYGFWKDVKRIELVRQQFDTVPGGIVVFITNDETYKQSPKNKSVAIGFSMTEGQHPKEKKWLDTGCKLAKQNHSFTVERDYSIQWIDKATNGIELHYCVLMV